MSGRLVACQVPPKFGTELPKCSTELPPHCREQGAGAKIVESTAAECKSSLAGHRRLQKDSLAAFYGEESDSKVAAARQMNARAVATVVKRAHRAAPWKKAKKQIRTARKLQGLEEKKVVAVIQDEWKQIKSQIDAA